LELVTASLGDVIVAEGGAADRFYIVDRGFLVAVQGPIDGKTPILRRMGRGRCSGSKGCC
jgi:CRP-like cAMP-binding protein